jgi:hypothetical protein
LLKVKIVSPDGSYKIISNEGDSQGKITSARTADGTTTYNSYHPNGAIHTSETKTPKTLHALQKNSMQTRAKTLYDEHGNPKFTITYKDNQVPTSDNVLSVKRYTESNPLEYELRAGSKEDGKLLEKRTAKKFNDRGVTELTTQVPSSQGDSSLKTKQIITIDSNNNISVIETFAKHNDSKSNKASETFILMPDDGAVTKIVTNAQGQQTKTIRVENDTMTIEEASNSISGNITTKHSIGDLKQSNAKNPAAAQANLASTANGSGQTPVGTTPATTAPGSNLVSTAYGSLQELLGISPLAYGEQPAFNRGLSPYAKTQHAKTPDVKTPRVLQPS